MTQGVDLNPLLNRRSGGADSSTRTRFLYGGRSAEVDEPEQSLSRARYEWARHDGYAGSAAVLLSGGSTGRGRDRRQRMSSASSRYSVIAWPSPKDGFERRGRIRFARRSPALMTARIPLSPSARQSSARGIGQCRMPTASPAGRRFDLTPDAPTRRDGCAHDK